MTSASKTPPTLSIMQAVPGVVARLDLKQFPTLNHLVVALQEFDVTLHLMRSGTRIENHFWRHEADQYGLDASATRVVVVTDPTGSTGVEAFINSLPELSGTEEVVPVQFAFLHDVENVAPPPLNGVANSHQLLNHKLYEVPRYMHLDVMVNGDGHYQGVPIAAGDKVTLVVVEPDTLDEWDGFHAGAPAEGGAVDGEVEDDTEEDVYDDEDWDVQDEL